jgi:peptidyl-prolyl cis-trans isomerase C
MQKRGNMTRERYKKLSIAPLIIIICASLVTGAKTPEAKPDDTTSEAPGDEATAQLAVAKVDGVPITLRYVKAVIKQERPVVRNELTVKDKRIAFINKLIRMELLADEAERRGFDKHDEVASVRKNQLASLMHKQIANSLGEVPPSEEELLKYYKENYSNYHKPEKVRARHILIADKIEAEKLLKRIHQKMISQLEFRRLAQEYSEDKATRTSGGDLAFFTNIKDRSEGDSQIDLEVVKAAFKLKKSGEIYPKLVKSAQGYHIVMRTGHREEMDISFEKAERRLTTLVGREKRKEKIGEAIDALKERFEVQVIEENLKYVVIDLSGGRVKPNGKGGMIENSRSFMPGTKLPGSLSNTGR